MQPLKKTPRCVARLLNTILVGLFLALLAVLLLRAPVIAQYQKYQFRHTLAAMRTSKPKSEHSIGEHLPNADIALSYKKNTDLSAPAPEMDYSARNMQSNLNTCFKATTGQVEHLASKDGWFLQVPIETLRRPARNENYYDKNNLANFSLYATNLPTGMKVVDSKTYSTAAVYFYVDVEQKFVSALDDPTKDKLRDGWRAFIDGALPMTLNEEQTGTWCNCQCEQPNDRGELLTVQNAYHYKQFIDKALFCASRDPTSAVNSPQNLTTAKISANKAPSHKLVIFRGVNDDNPFLMGNLSRQGRTQWGKDLVSRYKDILRSNVFEQVLILIFSIDPSSNSQYDKELEGVNDELSSWGSQNANVNDFRLGYVNLFDPKPFTQDRSLFDRSDVVELTIAIPSIVKVPSQLSVISFTISYPNCQPVDIQMFPFEPDVLRPQAWIDRDALLIAFLCLVQFALVGSLVLLYYSLLAFRNNWHETRESISERWHVPGISNPEPTDSFLEE